MSGFFSVKGFEKFQHYKDRSPPWIKLYNELLDDYEFGLLPDASKMHLVAIWLLASRYSNRVPHDAEWISRRINATDQVDLSLLERSGFIVVEQDCSTALSDCKQSAMPEREGETEREGDSEPNGSSAASAPLDLKSQIFGPCLDWLAKQSGKSESKLRPMVGRWCSRYGDGGTLDGLVAAARASPVDPIAWIEGVLGGTAKPKGWGQKFSTGELARILADEDRLQGANSQDDHTGDYLGLPGA